MLLDAGADINAETGAFDGKTDSVEGEWTAHDVAVFLGHRYVSLVHAYPNRTSPAASSPSPSLSHGRTLPALAAHTHILGHRKVAELLLLAGATPKPESKIRGMPAVCAPRVHFALFRCVGVCFLERAGIVHAITRNRGSLRSWSLRQYKCYFDALCFECRDLIR